MKTHLKRSLLRVMALSLVTGGAAISQADWYAWLGNSSVWGDGANWENQGTGVAGLPTSDDGLLISGWVTSTMPVLDINRTYDRGQFTRADIDLASNPLTLTTYIQMEDAILRNGTLSSGSLSASVPSNQLIDITGTFNSVSIGSDLTLTNSVVNTWSLSSYGKGTIDTTSSMTVFDPSATPNLFGANAFIADEFVVHGTLRTNGARIGFDTLIPPVPVGHLQVMAGGRWEDTSDTVKFVGIGSEGRLTIEGGTVDLSSATNVFSELRLGEGEIDFSSAGVDGKGTVTITNGGSLLANTITVGGESRWLVGGVSVSTGEGTVTVTDGLLSAKRILARDSVNLGRGSSTVTISGANARAEIGSIEGGAVNLDAGRKAHTFLMEVSNGAQWIGDYGYLLGGVGGSATANFSGLNTQASFRFLGIANGASVNVTSGAELRIEQAEIGVLAANGPATIDITDSSLRFDSKTGSPYNRLDVRGGLFKIRNSMVSVAPDQKFDVLVGGGNDDSKAIFEQVHFTAPGSIQVARFNSTTANPRLEVKSSSIYLDDFYDPSTGSLIASGNLEIGVGGVGTAEIRDSSLNVDRFRTGSGSGAQGTVELRNTTVTARAWFFPVTAPGSIVIGGPTSGSGTVELFNSTLRGEKVYIGPQGLLKGTGNINGNPLTGVGTEVTNHGTISPGHSPGTLNINGSLTLQSGSVLELEIDLSNPTRYDRIFATGTMNLGGTLRLKAIGSGIFDPALSYTLLGASSFSGMFSTFDIDPVLGISSGALSFNGGSYGINSNPAAVPEPATLAALGAALVVGLRRRRRSS